MAIWVHVRGWLEFHGQEAQAERVLGGEGWTFVRAVWSDVAFCVRDVRRGEENELLEQIREIAALPANEDGDHVSGLLHGFSEEDGPFEWHVRDGQVHIGPVPERYNYLWL
ncbi:hypothetical protein ACFY4C_18400 [Actinomadura viridis]|uniref:hypothetical protein n=1 Tax=Actinomadura viridis TaxID=58110 RepID=UPI0036890D4C